MQILHGEAHPSGNGSGWDRVGHQASIPTNRVDIEIIPARGQMICDELRTLFVSTPGLGERNPGPEASIGFNRDSPRRNGTFHEWAGHGHRFSMSLNIASESTDEPWANRRSVRMASITGATRGLRSNARLPSASNPAT